MENNYWYAVLQDHDDNDWGTGSFDLDEAKKMAMRMGEDAYIAIIDDGDDPVCVGAIGQEDF